jgi:hypothetical protein
VYFLVDCSVIVIEKFRKHVRMLNLKSMSRISRVDLYTQIKSHAVHMEKLANTLNIDPRTEVPAKSNAGTGYLYNMLY